MLFYCDILFGVGFIKIYVAVNIERGEVMFLKREQIKAQIKNIILDDVDNDVVFIVANRGIGKTAILTEIYGNNTYDPSFIMVDGTNIHKSCSVLKKCYVEGIMEYVSRNNKPDTRIRLCKEIKRYISLLDSIETVFVNWKRMKKQIIDILCDLSIIRLKEIYVSLAGDLPLILISLSKNLSSEEVDYFSSLHCDELGRLGARVTHIVAVRATDINIDCMNDLINKIHENVYILPMLPEIIEVSNCDDPKSIASITLNENEKIESLEDLNDKLVKSKEYYEMYHAAQRIYNNVKQPYNLFILAKEEISNENFEQIQKITREIYKQSNYNYENKILLPYNDKLMWLDSLTYYLALQMGIEKAIFETQRFFLSLIYIMGEYEEAFFYEKTERNSFGKFIGDVSKNEGNVFVEGFSKYFSDFALLVKTIYLNDAYNSQSYVDMLSAVQVLDRLLIEFSDDNLNALLQLFESTQICSIFDIGFQTLDNFISCEKISTQITRKENKLKNEKTINFFLENAFKVAGKWSDMTIINQLSPLLVKLKDKGYNIKLSLNNVICENNGEQMYFELARQIEKSSYRIGDFVMPKKTIFLSYAQVNKKIADSFEEKLNKLNFEVKRDIRDVGTWDNLQKFMKTIREEDYVVCLVSDTYLRRDNCMYEIMQLLKDDDYVDRTFPVIIEFTKDEIDDRKSEELCSSMFDKKYRIEIIKFWENQAKELAKEIKDLEPEDAAEEYIQYRETKNVAQNVSEFMHQYLKKELSATVKPDSKDKMNTVQDIVDSINKIVNANIHKWNFSSP